MNRNNVISLSIVALLIIVIASIIKTGVLSLSNCLIAYAIYALARYGTEK